MKHQSNHLDVGKVIEEFRKAEKSPVHRKDAFKINGKFEDAVKKIPIAKPESNNPQK
jgi:hypothetical protein